MQQEVYPLFGGCRKLPQPLEELGHLHFGLAKRLKKARQAAGLARRPLDEKAGLSNGVVQRIEDEQTVPNSDTVERIAEALQVSPCYLAFGIETEFIPSTTLRSEGIADRLKQTRERAGLSKKALAEQAEISRGMVLYIEEGSTVPSVATAERLANALGVSPCWLAYGEGPEVLPKPVRRRTVRNTSPQRRVRPRPRSGQQ
jgi:transcriptional regulator with XRE-family HTH domain